MGSSVGLNIIDKFKVEEYLGSEKYLLKENDDREQVGVVNAMSYTIVGGDILKIEVNYFKGNGNIIMTGFLGDVFRESAQLALSYIKSNVTKFKIDYKLLEENDIHVHVPYGAVKKDGPSAGIAITTAIISVLTGMKVKNNISMTGEITLRGEVLPVGGLKEKIIGARKALIKTIYLPLENKNEVLELEKELNSNLKYIFVKEYEEIYKKIFVKKVKKELVKQ